MRRVAEMDDADLRRWAESAEVVVLAASSLIAVRREYRTSYKPNKYIGGSQFREHPGGDYWEQKFMDAYRPLEVAVRKAEAEASDGH